MKKKKSEKQHHKSEAEILVELQKQKEVLRKRALIKEKFYPALCESSKSIDDAKMFVQSLSSVIMEKFLSAMKDKPFKELKLIENLDPKDPKYEELKELIGLFEGESVFTARELFEGMRYEIEMMIQKEMGERELSSLKTNFL